MFLAQNTRAHKFHLFLHKDPGKWSYSKKAKNLESVVDRSENERMEDTPHKKWHYL